MNMNEEEENKHLPDSPYSRQCSNTFQVLNHLTSKAINYYSRLTEEETRVKEVT